MVVPLAETVTEAASPATVLQANAEAELNLFHPPTAIVGSLQREGDIRVVPHVRVGRR
jgi:hypothetical protein